MPTLVVLDKNSDLPEKKIGSQEIVEYLNEIENKTK